MSRTMISPPYDPAHPYWRRILLMSFPDRLAAARHARKLSQAQLSRATAINQSQIKRYETGLTQPSLEALRKLAVALHVSIDALVFDEGERGPDDELRLAFEAVATFDPEDKAMATRIIQGLILQHQAKIWSKAS